MSVIVPAMALFLSVLDTCRWLHGWCRQIDASTHGLVGRHREHRTDLETAT
jgi:hypothetical protein